jgi:hypothetical protein
VSAAALVAALDAAGIHIAREDDNLRVGANPGVILVPYVDDLRQHKATLLALLAVQDEIVKAATVARAAFDRQHFAALWERWYALRGEELP